MIAAVVALHAPGIIVVAALGVCSIGILKRLREYKQWIMKARWKILPKKTTPFLFHIINLTDPK